MKRLWWIVLLCPSIAWADVQCPDLVQNRQAFYVVAQGRVHHAIEPVFENGCEREERNALGQCARLKHVQANRYRLQFDIDQMYYVNAGVLPQDAANAMRSVILIGDKDMVGKRGLLRSFEKDANGDLLVQGCESFMDESDPAYASELAKAKTLKQ